MPLNLKNMAMNVDIAYEIVEKAGTEALSLYSQ